METPVNQKIGMRIRNIRKTQGLTQEQLAESVSLSPSYISRVETWMWAFRQFSTTCFLLTRPAGQPRKSQSQSPACRPGFRSWLWNT